MKCHTLRFKKTAHPTTYMQDQWGLDAVLSWCHMPDHEFSVCHHRILNHIDSTLLSSKNCELARARGQQTFLSTSCLSDSKTKRVVFRCPGVSHRGHGCPNYIYGASYEPQGYTIYLEAIKLCFPLVKSEVYSNKGYTNSNQGQSWDRLGSRSATVAFQRPR